MESDVTEFSPEILCIQEAAKHLLASARRYRKDRHWALTPEDAKPLPEGWAWSYDEAGGRAWYAANMGREAPETIEPWPAWCYLPLVGAAPNVREWPETIEWPEELEQAEEECPPPSERRILEYLASEVHGALTYRIWMSSSGDGYRQRPSRPRRPRPPRVLPNGSPSLLLTVFWQAPDDSYPPPQEQRDVTQRIQEMERRITSLKRVEDHTLLEDERWEDAAAYRQERRSLWQELQILKTSLHTPPQSLQGRVACKSVTMIVGLDEMSQHEQQRWRKWLDRSPHTTWRAAFRAYLCRHSQMGRNPIYIDVHTTTEDDVTVQVLAYLLQAEIMSWNAIEPWVKYYAASWGQETEGKRWSKYEHQRWFEKMRSFALPQEANALRPRDTTKPPDTMSLLEAAKTLGLTEPQIRYRVKQGDVRGVIRPGGFLYIPTAEITRLLDDAAIKAVLTRPTTKPRQKNAKPSASDEEVLQARIAECDDEALQARIEELDTRKELATTPAEVQTAMEILEEARKQLRQRQRGSDT